MKSSVIILVIGCVLLGVACIPSFRNTELKAIPIHMDTPISQDVNLDTVFQIVESEVKKTLPNAYFQSIAINGTCSDLAQFRGNLGFTFLQINTTLFDKQIIRALANVNLVEQTIDVSYMDETDFYPLTTKRDFNGDHFIRKLILLVQQRLADKGAVNCNKIYLSQDDTMWNVQYLLPTDCEGGKCQFEIFNDEIEKALELEVPSP